MPTSLGYMGKYLKEPTIQLRILDLFDTNPTAVITREVQFPDISFYQGVVNFDILATKTIAVIIRAGQNVWTDTQFSRNWSEAKRKGLKRGAYWFYDDRQSPATQSAILINLIKNDRPEMEVFVDWENTYGGPYGGLKNVVQFMQQVEGALPGIRVGIYTGYYWFKDHSSATANPNEYAYLRNHSLWLAWYTSNPDYVKVPEPWAFLTHWQFGTPPVGVEWGANTGSLDMNFFNGSRAEFDIEYGVSTSPQPDEMLFEHSYFPGSMYRRWVTHTSHGDIIYHTVSIDLTRARCFISPFPAARTYVQNYLKRHKLTFAINASGWTNPTPTTIKVSGFGASEGQAYPNGGYGEDETVYISKDNHFVYMYPPEGLWNAVSFPNLLVKDGIIQPVVFERKDYDPRSLSFVSQDEKTLVFMCVDGIEAGVGQRTGLNYEECVIIGRRMGAYNMWMHDGGGSSTLVTHDAAGTPITLNVPCGDEYIDIYKANLTPVANIFGVWLDSDVPGTPGGNMPQAREMLGKTVTVRSTPTVVTGNGTAESIAPFTTIDYVEILSDINHMGDPAYQWLKLSEGRYVNYFYPPNGQRFELLSLPEPPAEKRVIGATVYFDDQTTEELIPKP